MDAKNSNGLSNGGRFLVLLRPLGYGGERTVFMAARIDRRLANAENDD